MFSLLLCVAAGIRPVITSSSDDKLAAIKKLDPSVRGLNYKTVSDQASEIKRLTDGRGVDFVVNNTGVGSIPDDISFLAPRGGTISLVGFLAGFDADWEPKKLMDLMFKTAKLQGIAVGSRKDFQDMNQFLEEKKVKLGPLLDRSFAFKEAKEAFAYLESAKHSGKVIIKVD